MSEIYQVGSVWKNKYGDIRIIKEYRQGKRLKYDVEFIDTGTIREGVLSSSIYNANIKDCIYPYIHDVGYLGGYYSPNQTPIMKKLYSRWERIISRCYNVNDPRYDYYGGIGIKVSEEWHNFLNFYNDMMKMENIGNILEGRSWQIDKDIICNQLNIKPHIYSKETVKVVHMSDNISESNKVVRNYNKYKKGVNHHVVKGKPCFIVTYNNDDKLDRGLRKYFWINNLGYDTAHEMAIQQRLKWEKEYN